MSLNNVVVEFPDHRAIVTAIEKIYPHPNPDKTRIEVARIGGWEVVVSKDRYKVGDPVVYIPIDAVLPLDLEHLLFPAEAKIRPKNGRIRCIKIGGQISQGMVIPLTPVENDKSNDVLNLYPTLSDVKVGDDVTDLMNIGKYEEPELPDDLTTRTMPNKKNGPRRRENKHFNKYHSLVNLRNAKSTYEVGELVVADEKVHGTNFGAGVLPVDMRTRKWWRRLWNDVVKGVFWLIRKPMPQKYEFVYRSHNVQLQNKMELDPNSRNVYARVAAKYDLPNRLAPGTVIYGEIYGHGVQKNYSYGCQPGEVKLVIFDVEIDGKYLNPDERNKWCADNGFDVVPEVYRGPYTDDIPQKIARGPSLLSASQKVREGVVFRNLTGENRRVRKYVSDAFLLDDNTDFH
jgi:RNA ligase (TIGR02306 family)